ncbi:hypothetical protein GGI24_005455, partial [Coemansia furcata]
MSLTGFLFGNVDEEGHLSDNELDPELRNTLGGEEANEYLSGILGSALFSEGAPNKQDDDDEDDEEQGPVSTPAIKPQRDAIDYSDFNELADDSAVPRRDKWEDDVGFKFGTTVERAQVDDDYDDDDEEEDVEQVEQAEFAESDEEVLEDLFDSPEVKPDDGSEQPADLHLESPETTPPPLASPDVLEEEEEAVVPRPPKRIIPSGPIKFTDYFGCHITRQVKRRRRQPPLRQNDDDDVEVDGKASQQLVMIDTRRLLAGSQSLLPTRPESGFLQAVVAQSMADDTSCDVYVTINERTGAETSQRTVPRRAVDTAAAVFQDTALPLALDDWEQRIMWEDDADDESKAEPVADNVMARQVLAQTGGELVSDFEAHVIWDPDTAFLPSTRLQINLNDQHMLLESSGGETRNDASAEWRGGVDRLNQSNDHFYAVQQSGKAHRVRQTFGQLVVAHSLAALKLQAPFFR